MPQHLTPSSEDYLEAIYDLSQDGAAVRSVDVSTRLGVSRASVNKAVGLLKDAGYVLQQPYGTITLTEDGGSAAARVRRCHTFLRNFFVETLGVAPDVAETEACTIEHAISDETLDRWMRFMARYEADRPGAENGQTKG